MEAYIVSDNIAYGIGVNPDIMLLSVESAFLKYQMMFPNIDLPS